MIIKGKEIKAETITMWLNVLSFIVGIIFYFRLEHSTECNEGFRFLFKHPVEL
jgi:hypothetical protein